MTCSGCNLPLTLRTAGIGSTPTATLKGISGREWMNTSIQCSNGVIWYFKGFKIRWARIIQEHSSQYGQNLLSLSSLSKMLQHFSTPDNKYSSPAQKKCIMLFSMQHLREDASDFRAITQMQESSPTYLFKMSVEVQSNAIQSFI